MSDERGDASLPAEMPSGTPAQRASDDDREVVVTRLRDAAGRGILDLDELEERLGLVYSAKTLPDLARITADLPAPQPPPPAPPPSRPFDVPALRDSGFQHHFTVYVMVIGMLIGIWLLSGAGHFWPFYPAAGWGIGLAPHFLSANQAVKRREQGLDRPDDTAGELGASGHDRSGGQIRPAARADVSQDERARRYEERDRDRERRHRERDEDRARRRGAPPPTPSAAPAAPSGASGGGEADGVRRRFVVAMFVDVVGSTELNEALGDESWSRVRDRYRELLRECFEAEGGWEVNIAGDGVLARFEHPTRAVKSAVEVQRRLHRRREESGFAPTVRIGIHSGDVVTDGDDLIGSVVNLAARVTSAAEPEEIFVTEHVADHLNGSLITEGRGLHTLKGIGRPRHLLAVRWR